MNANAVDKSVVFDDELESIKLRRQRAGLDVPKDADEARETLTGLALSGGGIRSASFNLGLLQALHRFNVLRLFDYMSIVSGGGYIGSYLSSLAPIKTSGDAWTQAQRAKTRQRCQPDENSGRHAKRSGHIHLACYHNPHVVHR